MKHFLIVFMALSFATRSQERQLIELPTESEVGRVFLASLLISANFSPPEEIIIYPALYERDGQVQSTNRVSVLIQGEAIKQFLDLLAKPAEIGLAPESCPNLILERGGSPPRMQLIGSVMLDKEAEHVRFRLITGSPIYPKIDFVYRGSGMKEFLLKRVAQYPPDGK